MRLICSIILLFPLLFHQVYCDQDWFIKKYDDIHKMAVKNNEKSKGSNFFSLYHIDGRPVDSWRSLEGRYPKQLDGYAKIGQKKFRLKLEQNIELLANNYNELPLKSNETNNLDDFCYYRGKLAGVENSYAAVNLCKGKIDGTFNDENSRYFVESENYNNVKIFTELPREDGFSTNLTCGFTNSARKSTNFVKMIRQKRAIDRPGYYNKYVKWGQLYVELALVFDDSMYKKYNRDADLLYDRAKRLANLMNAFYQPLNVKIALVGVEIWTNGDQITVNNSGDTTLEQFHRYRQYRLLNNIPNDNAQLITDVPFNGGVVGKALKGTMCSAGMSDAVVNDHSSREIAVAATMAHEMGHNFGMEHDNETCECPQDRCIMAASSGNLAPLYWSTCSLEYLSWSLIHGGDFCLKNKPEHIYGSPICGNGFTEPGEDCDCGVPDVCTNKCCNATTCKFAAGAVCATGECCDVSNCAVKPLATVCRASSNDCDLEEYCNGKSEQCPADVYKHDGIACNSNMAYCGGGRCASHNDQCQLLWGPSGKSASDVCYSLNRNGDPRGNCGLYRHNNTYVPCANRDVDCGLLQCMHSNEKTAYGDKPVVRYSNTVLRSSDGTATVCQTAMLDLGYDNTDPGLAPNGAICGSSKDRKMCYDRKCTDVESVISKNNCQNNCHNVGTCNNLGHCHCDPGYGGVDCSIPGLGGSIDSGPASVGGGFNVGIGVLVFLFVIIPIIVVVVTLLYRRKIIKAPKMKIFHALFPQSLAPRNTKRPPAPPSTGQQNPSRSTGNSAQQKFSPMMPVVKVTVSSSNSPPSSIYYSKPSAIVKPMTVSSGDSRSNLDTVYSSDNQNVDSGAEPRKALKPVVHAAPPRPRRPDDVTMEKLYAEAPELAPSPDLLSQVLTVLDNDGSNGKDIVPQRRAPPPPEYAEPGKYADVAAPPPKPATVSEKKKMFEAPGAAAPASVVRNAAAAAISKPVNPIIGGEPVLQAPSLTVVSRIENETLPRRNKAAVPATKNNHRSSTDNIDPDLDKIAKPAPAKITADRLQRSVSSVSNGPRPVCAPPLPPKPSRNIGNKNQSDKDENYYDIIPSPSDDPGNQGRGRLNKTDADDEDLYADIDEYRVADTAEPMSKQNVAATINKLNTQLDFNRRNNKERSKSPLKK